MQFKETKIGMFPVDWVECRVKDLGEIITGKTPPTEDDNNFGVDYMFITPEDLGDFKYIDNTIRYLSEQGIKYTFKIPTNSICFASIGYIGKIGIVTKESCTNQQINSIICNDVTDSDFLYYLLEKSAKRIEAIAGITAVPQINKSDLSKIRIVIPSTKFEQQKIASILSSLDDTIKSTRTSIAKLERLKKSLIQNLLSGKMKSDGTWRNDDEFYMDEKFGKVPVDWLVKFVGDNDVAVINPNYEYEINKPYDFLEMSDVDEKYKGIIKYEKVFLEKRNSGYSKFKNSDILFAKITPCTENGKIAFIEGCSSDIGFGSTEFITISPTENVDGYFLYLNLISHSVHGRSVALMEGTTGRQRVPTKIFKNVIQIPLPNIDEQRLIARKIKLVEDMIKNKFQKLPKLEKLKKSLMQKLLTGQVRVK